MVLSALTPLRALGQTQREYQMPPELEESLLRSIGGSALSGLGWIGETLGKPVSTVTGILSGLSGGEWGGGLLNLIPFSDTLGITDPQERVGGRDLLEEVGLLGRNQAGLDFGDVAGFAAEVGLDPLTYLTMGASATTKAGQLAKAAGVFDDVARIADAGPRLAGMTTTLEDIVRAAPSESTALADILRAGEAAGYGIGPTAEMGQRFAEPLRGLFGIGLPFTEATAPAMALGPTARRTASVLDDLGASVRWSTPGRFAHMLLNPDAAGEFSRLGQETAIHANQLVRAAKPQGRLAAIEAGRASEDLLRQFTSEMGNAADESLGNTLNQIVQFTAEGGDVAEGFGKFAAEGFMPSDRLSQSVADLAGSMNESNREIYATLLEKGGMGGWLEGSGEFQHFPRYRDLPNKPPARSGSTLLQQVTGSQLHRTEPIATLRKDVIDDILADPAAWEKGSADYLRGKYGDMLNPKYGGAEKPAEGLANHAKALASWVKQHDKKAFLEEGAQLFPNQPLENYSRYQVGVRKASASIDAIHEMFHRSLSDEVGIPLKDAFRRANMNPEQAATHFAEKFGVVADDVLVSEDAVQAATSLAKYFSDPEWRTVIGQAVDSFTNLFKKSVTIPFPAFATRNFFSGQVVNLTSGIVETPADIARYGKAFREAAGIPSKTPDAEIQRFLDELEAFSVTGHHRTFMDVDTTVGSQRGVLPGNPLDVKTTYREVQDVIGQSPAFPSIRGNRLGEAVGRATDTGRRVVEPYVGTMAKANQWAEWMNRAAPFIYLRRKGWSPQAAAEKVLELQFDYGRLSPVEKTYARRLAPFYTFSRKIAGLTFDTLSQRPGGALAQLIRATNQGRESSANVPDYVAETASIPLGESDDGTQRFITGLGLAHEDPLQFFGGGFKDVILEAMSRTNPLVKFPSEVAAGQSFFQKGPTGGRPLEDLDPVMGRTISNIDQMLGGEYNPRPEPVVGSWFEHLMLNTPASRALTTARTLSDPRKHDPAGMLNLLSGVRVSDISPATQDATLRERMTAELRNVPGAREHVSTYVPEDVIDAMMPAERERTERIKAVNRALDRRAKQRAAERKVGAGRL